LLLLLVLPLPLLMHEELPPELLHLPLVHLIDDQFLARALLPLLLPPMLLLLRRLRLLLLLPSELLLPLRVRVHLLMRLLARAAVAQLLHDLVPEERVIERLLCAQARRGRRG
jgi:hypothetical protein